MSEGRTARPRVILVIGILGVLEGALRLFFYYEAVFAGVTLLQPMPTASTMAVVNGINLALGLAGLVAISGLLLMTRWGYWGTIGVSLLTVAFDGVSSVMVSFTAFAGLILPVIFLVVLLSRRVRYSSGRRTT
jgi:hypothetical protein